MTELQRKIVPALRRIPPALAKGRAIAERKARNAEIRWMRYKFKKFILSPNELDVDEHKKRWDKVGPMVKESIRFDDMMEAKAAVYAKISENSKGYKQRRRLANLLHGSWITRVYYGTVDHIKNSIKPLAICFVSSFALFGITKTIGLKFLAKAIGFVTPYALIGILAYKPVMRVWNFFKGEKSEFDDVIPELREFLEAEVTRLMDKIEDFKLEGE